MKTGIEGKTFVELLEIPIFIDFSHIFNAARSLLFFPPSYIKIAPTHAPLPLNMKEAQHKREEETKTRDIKSSVHVFPKLFMKVRLKLSASKKLSYQ